MQSQPENHCVVQLNGHILNPTNSSKKVLKICQHSEYWFQLSLPRNVMTNWGFDISSPLQGSFGSSRGILKQNLVFGATQVEARLELSILTLGKPGQGAFPALPPREMQFQMKRSQPIPSAVNHWPPLEGIKTARILLKISSANCQSFWECCWQSNPLHPCIFHKFLSVESRLESTRSFE